MNHRRNWIPVLIALIALPSVAAASRETWREQSEFVRDAKGIQTIRVENARGQTTVRASSDGRIHLLALKIARAGSQREARKLASTTLVELDDRGGSFSVSVRYPNHAYKVNLWQDFSGVQLPEDEVRLLIEVPAGRSVSLSASSGDLTSDGIDGPQELHTASGDIALSEAAGRVTVHTASGDVTGHAISFAKLESTSGDIELEGPLGAIQIGTTSGDVVVRDAGDSLRIGTVSGDVRVSRAARGLEVTTTSGGVDIAGAGGAVSATTLSGDLEVALTRDLRRAVLATHSGSLSVALDPTTAATLDLGTGSGDMEIDGPIQQTRRTRHNVQANLRGGGVPIELRSQSGDISVTVGGK